MDLVSSIRERHERVLDTISAASRRAGRSPDSVRLVVVTKSQPLHVVEAAITAGARILGENYAEEAVAKMQAIQGAVITESTSGNPARMEADRASTVEWHMIGHVQGRKAKLVAPNFDLIHSLDSVKLAERLDRLGVELGRQVPVLLEFNVGGEIEKHGWPASDEATWTLLERDIEAVAGSPNIKICGLMTMPPLSADPEDARTYFRRLRRLQDFLEAKFPKAQWNELSMGTSADYPIAVEEGATLVRVGEAILGPRSIQERT